MTSEEQMMRDAFQFFLAGEVCGHAPQGKDVTADPESVAVFGGQNLVLAAEDLS